MKNHSLSMIPVLFLCASAAMAQSLNFDFESDTQGWICDFADYPKADSVNWHLQSKIGAMPDILPKQNGIIMKGDNFSDDLFFFLKKPATGLGPNAAYTVVYSIDVVTNSGPGMIGGSDLMLKAGATLIEPRKQLASNGMYRMNIDKNNQSGPGPDMDTLGRIEHAIPNVSDYRLATFTNAKHPFPVKTDAQGRLWLIVGAESQFETPAEFLVAAIRISLSSPTGLRFNLPAKGLSKTASIRFGTDYSLIGRRGKGGGPTGSGSRLFLP